MHRQSMASCQQKGRADESPKDVGRSVTGRPGNGRPAGRNRLSAGSPKACWRLCPPRHFVNSIGGTLGKSLKKVVLGFAAALDRKADLATPLRVFLFAGECERTPCGNYRGGARAVKRTFRPGKLRLEGTGLTRAEVEA